MASSLAKLEDGLVIIRVDLLDHGDQEAFLLHKAFMVWLLGCLRQSDLLLGLRSSSSRAGLALLRCPVPVAGLGLHVMHAPHVVTEVPVAWEAGSWLGPFTVLQLAAVWLISMAVHGVGFTLMTQ